VVRRKTNQRKAIREVFARADRPLSTHEVLDAAQRHKAGLGIATVYRTLKLFLDEGWLTAVKLPGEPPRYEIAGKPHHHHFYCGLCGRVFEVPGSSKLFDALVPQGFTLESHELVLYGRCDTCGAQDGELSRVRPASESPARELRGGQALI
jgi:Fur family ferric uptake transcriptional regulator